MAPKPYWLGDNVHVCFCEHGAVLLDLNRDAYFGMDAEQAQSLVSLVEGWPPVRDEKAGPHPDAELFAEKLRARGLLSRMHERGHVVVPAVVPAVEEQLITWEQMGWRHIRVRHVLLFVMSVLIVAGLLRFRSFRFVLLRAARRKASCGCPTTPFDLQLSREVVSAFYYIRVFFYGKKRRCLFDSAVLLELLAFYRIYPHWVIGVQAQPFAAHSWVQMGSAVLNGTPEFVRAYTPILVI